MTSPKLVIAFAMCATLQTVMSATGASTCQVVDGKQVCAEAAVSNNLLQRKLDKPPAIDENRERLIDAMVDRSLRARGAHRAKMLQTGRVENATATGVLNPDKVLFFTHHKTGTILARNIARHMADILGEWEVEFWWAPEGGHPCTQTFVATYQNMEEATFKRLQAECPGFRAVHFVREVAALTTSAYLYHSDPSTCDSIPGAADDYATLSSKPLEEGILLEADVQSRFTVKDALTTRTLSEDLPNVMRVGLEEFGDDFDGMTRKMFSFLVGSDHPKIDEMVKAAAVEDTNRWSESQVQASNHVADKARTDHVLDTLLALQNTSDVVQKLFAADPPLGYEIPPAP